MEIALFVVVVVLAGVVVLQATRKPKAAASSPVAAPAISADELSARVELAAQKALTEAVARLNAQAEQDRKEAIRLATESVTKSGQELLDTKAQVIDATLR
ncbi:MAG: hypothetical protein ACKO2Q_04185, partial [Actinomycetota bacterium]